MVDEVGGMDESVFVFEADAFGEGGVSGVEGRGEELSLGDAEECGVFSRLLMSSSWLYN